MRSLVTSFEQRLASFLDQRLRLLLVVQAGSAEQVALSKLLETLEQKREQDVFWSFAQRFDDAEQYVSVLLDYVTQRMHVLGLHWARENREPLPPLPAQVRDTGRSPVQRLRAALMHLRSLLSDLSGRALVVALTPCEIGNAEAFASFVLELLSHEVQAPWCHHMRFIVREQADGGALARGAGALYRAEVFKADFGSEAIERSLEHDVNDAALPLPARLQSLLVLAGLDTAHKRIPDAIEKYRLLYRYYSTMSDKPMVAVSLNGVGEAFARGGDFANAKKYLEGALTPAIESQSVGVVCSATFNLAYLHFSHAHYERAYDYYAALGALAQAMGNAPLKLHALEQMGVCKQRQGQYDQAMRHFKEAVQLAQTLEATAEHVSALERVRGLLEEGQMNEHVRGINKLIADVESQGAAAARAGAFVDSHKNVPGDEVST